MTSTIKVNNIQNQCGANIINESSNTITIGASGDTVSLASGASQSGFGRTGTVNWDTTAKTASFTAANGEGYFVNTTSGAITVTLPASPSAGSIVGIKDYATTFATNNVTVARNGSLINGNSSNFALSTNGQSILLVYVDGTKGWLPTQDDSSTFGVSFVAATGGSITTAGDFKIHTFTGPGTFCVSCAGSASGSNSVDYLVVAGGGGGGTGCSHGAGGGAGGFRESHSTPVSGCYTASPLATPTALPVSVQGYPITVGGGGAGAPNPSPKFGGDGNNSIFSTITSTGGGGGGGWNDSGGRAGGSGSGAACNPNKSNVGAGNTPPVSPPQGNPGGPTNPAGSRMGGGGGAGEAGNTDGEGSGGDGVTTAIRNTGSITYAGGGSAGGSSGGGANVAGGDGGGGQGQGPGGGSPAGTGGSGTANTGGGGGGSFSTQNGGAGGSGIVIIRYKFQ
jgi:hypothetical protein